MALPAAEGRIRQPGATTIVASSRWTTAGPRTARGPCEVERPQACGSGAADPERHDLGLGDRLGMAVGPPVERVEGALRAGEAVGRGRAERHGELERLTAIAHVDQGVDPAALVARSSEEPAGLAIEAGHLAAQVGRPDASRLAHPAPPKVVAHVGEEQAEGRCDARVRGQDHA